jgi:hypothetical protein
MKFEKDEQTPFVQEKYYDDNGILCGMLILVECGELPVTAEQYSQWYRQKFGDEELKHKG